MQNIIYSENFCQAYTIRYIFIFHKLDLIHLYIIFIQLSLLYIIETPNSSNPLTSSNKSPNQNEIGFLKFKIRSNLDDCVIVL